MEPSEKFWNRAAETYDQEEKKDDSIALQVIESTRPYLQGGDVVLDFGCGTGRFTNELAGQVQAIHGVDTSAKMIAIAQQKAQARRIENIAYAHATIFDERYTPGVFDALLAFYILHLLADSPPVLPRIHELLKPGGWFISVTPCLGEKQAFPMALLPLLSKMGFVPKVRSLKIAQLKEWITHAHFEIVETQIVQQNTSQYFIAARVI